MKRSTMPRIGWSLAVLALLMAGCAGYERKPLSFKVPTGYPNHQTRGGITVGVRPMDDAEEARKVFGFDILGSGVLPVQVVIENKGGGPVEIIAGQTFLVEADGTLWNLLRGELAFERIEKRTKWAEVTRGAGKGALLGSMGGAVVGAAVGIVSGENVVSTTAKGATVGGAAGTVVGGANALEDTDVKQAIRRDLEANSLEGKRVRPGELGHGLLFFPSEAHKPTTLKLQLRDIGTADLILMDFAL